jgi:hypothetical protein
MNKTLDEATASDSATAESHNDPTPGASTFTAPQFVGTLFADASIQV